MGNRVSGEKIFIWDNSKVKKVSLGSSTWKIKKINGKKKNVK